MDATWSDVQLAALDDAEELLIATGRADRTWPAVPIWIVVVDGRVYARTWQRRTTGWFGRAVATRAAHVALAVADLDTDVTVQEVGSEQQAGIEAAYRSKYSRYGEATVARMVGDDAVAATLRFEPVRPNSAPQAARG